MDDTVVLFLDWPDDGTSFDHIEALLSVTDVDDGRHGTDDEADDVEPGTDDGVP
ncbi:hypothetical protein [Haloarchaeobius sp. HRN-SO-5]|uniref:hypothetical protein n=1 Tax=Haloarchaeobius sp. HRN-SO-5 TaxID=3446118 RepID=UPI003EBD1135